MHHGNPYCDHTKDQRQRDRGFYAQYAHAFSEINVGKIQNHQAERVLDFIHPVTGFGQFFKLDRADDEEWQADAQTKAGHHNTALTGDFEFAPKAQLLPHCRQRVGFIGDMVGDL